MFLIIVLVQLLLPTHQQFQSANLSVINEIHPITVTYLNLSFTAATSPPVFQLFTRSAQLSYQLVNPQPLSTYFVIEPLTGVVCEEITLIFNNPQGLFGGKLNLASYMLTTKVLAANAPPMEATFWVYGIIIFITCLYGIAGLMLLEFTQISIIASGSIVLTKTFTQLLYDIMFFRWGAPWFTELDSNCFLNNALVIIVVLALVVIAALFVRRFIGQGASRYPKVKYFFNYNLLILVYDMTFLPLCVSIIRDLNLLSTAAQPFGALMIVNHILCVLFLILVLFSFYVVGKIVNRNEQPNSTYYKVYNKLFSGLKIKRWYRRNEKIFTMVKLAVVAVCSGFFAAVFFIAIVQALEMFAVFILQLYTSRLYNKFRTYVSVSIFVQFIVYAMEFMFQYMSSTLLGFQGTFVIECVAIGLYTINSAAFIGLSLYEAVVRLRTWIRKLKNPENESAKQDQMVEMVETNRQQSLLNKHADFEDESPKKIS